MRSFDAFWRSLQTELKKPTKITNWTRKKGVIGEGFTAHAKDPDHITCTIMSGTELNVPRRDFRLVYENWEDYLAERILRSDLAHGKTGNSRFTKYTISITHQFS